MSNTVDICNDKNMLKIAREKLEIDLCFARLANLKTVGY